MYKKALTVAIAGALAAPLAAQAVDYTLSGHVHRTLFIYDNDTGTQASVGENNWSQSRVRFNGRSDLENGNYVRTQFELGMNADPHNGADDVRIRHANGQFGGNWGRLTLGQGSEAGDGAVYVDKSGVYGIQFHAGYPAAFTDDAVGKVADYFSDFSGGGRAEMIRYDTPALGSVSAAASVANGDRVSAKVGYNTDLGGTAVTANLTTLQLPGKNANVAAAVGAAMPSGFTVAVAVANQKNAGHASDPEYLRASIGYKFGNTSIGLSWYNGSDFVDKGSESTSVGAGVTHVLPKANADIYAFVRNFDAKNGDKVDTDETLVAIGTRVRF